MREAGPPDRAMAAPTEDAKLRIVFGRAFLLELERGDFEMASVFARAFLKQRSGPERNS